MASDTHIWDSGTVELGFDLSCLDRFEIHDLERALGNQKVRFRWNGQTLAVSYDDADAVADLLTDAGIDPDGVSGADPGVAPGGGDVEFDLDGWEGADIDALICALADDGIPATRTRHGIAVEPDDADTVEAALARLC